MYLDRKKILLLAILVLLILAVAAVLYLIPEQGTLTMTMEGDREIIVEIGEAFDDPGATASWTENGKTETVAVKTIGNVNIYKFGVYERKYLAQYGDRIATAYRRVTVVDTEKPKITLYFDPFSYTVAGNVYEEEGFDATDNYDGDITDRVVRTETADKITYTVSDSYGNVTTVERTIQYVSADIPEDTEQPPEQVIGNPNGKTIYLTFDDGPGKHTPRLLDVLKKYNVKATFFVVKNGNSKTIKREAAEGHTVAAHTASHVYKEVYASEEAYFKDLDTVRSMILGLTGQECKILRFPGGSSNKSSLFNPGIMTRLTQLVQEKGYVYFDWHVDSKDSVGAKTAQEVYENVTQGIMNCKSKSIIVLQHDIKAYSVDAVESIILWGLRNGYAFRALTTGSPVYHHRVRN